MLSLIRLGTISLFLIAASLMLVHLSIADEAGDFDEVAITSLLDGLEPSASSSDVKLQDDNPLGIGLDNIGLGQIAQARADEEPFPLSGVLSEDTFREGYDGDIIAFKQYRAAGYVAPFSASLGSIIGRLDYWTALNEGDVVYIDIGTNKGAKLGDRYSIISKDTSLLDPVDRRGFQHEEVYKYNQPYRHDLWIASPLFLPNDVGHRVLQVGILEITQIGADKSEARVLVSTDAIYVGDSLGVFSPERPSMVSATFVPPKKNIRGHLLGYKLVSPTVDGQGEIMYLNVGLAQNVALGDRFVAYMIPQTEDVKVNGGDLTPMLKHIIGEMVVVRIKQNSSSVLVLKSTRPLTPGTLVMSKD